MKQFVIPVFLFSTFAWAQTPGIKVEGNFHIHQDGVIYFGAPVTIDPSATNVSSNGHLILADGISGEDKLSLQSDAHLDLRGTTAYVFLDNAEFAQLSLANTAEVSVEPGKYLLLSGSIDHQSTGKITLEANSTAYAQLKFNGYNGNGEVEQQRYFQPGWNFVSSAMQSTTAAIFGSVGTDGGNANTMNLFSWDGVNFTNVLNNAATVDVAKGYMGFIGANGIRTAAGMQAFTGKPNTSATMPSLVAGNVNAASQVTLANNNQTRGGWNLVANPFTCNLDVNGISRANFNAAFYRFNRTTGNYESFAPASPPTPGDIVPPLTAFWMQANGSNAPQLAGGTLTMTTHGTVLSSSNSSPRANFDRLVLRSSLDNDTTKQDFTVVSFLEGTTDGFDGEWDAHKMANTNGYPNIYSTHTNGDVMAINAIPYGPGYSDKKTVPISFNAEQHGGNYTIRFDDSYMINTYAVYLEDKLEQTFTDLTSQDYSFMNDTNMVNRFVLHFRAGALSMDAPENLKNASGITAWVFDNQAYLNAQFNGTAMLSLHDISGKKLQSDRLTLSKGQRAEWPLRADLAAGMYLLRVETAAGSQTIKFTK